jgi:hypothetical protein
MPDNCIQISKPKLNLHDAFARVALAVSVKDVVSVGRLIAASVFGRRRTSIFTDRKHKSRESSDLSPLMDHFFTFVSGLE